MQVLDSCVQTRLAFPDLKLKKYIKNYIKIYTIVRLMYLKDSNAAAHSVDNDIILRYYIYLRVPGLTLRNISRKLFSEGEKVY